MKSLYVGCTKMKMYKPPYRGLLKPVLPLPPCPPAHKTSVAPTDPRPIGTHWPTTKMGYFNDPPRDHKISHCPQQDVEPTELGANGTSAIFAPGVDPLPGKTRMV